jgi:hypothetical protein
MPAPLYQVAFDAAALLRDHPPVLRHPHKAALFDIAYPEGVQPTGVIGVSRWEEHVPPLFLSPSATTVEIRPDFYDYARADGLASEWHVNFADPRLFVAYGSRLFAQDEMQVAEHPLLACVREALLARGLSALTRDHTGATPILVRSVERRIAVATDVNAAAGRPSGLYGNRFADAPFDAIRQATRRVDPPTVSNVIAMAAPSGGYGDYTAREIEIVYSTAHTAFAAAVQESPGQAVVIHTGFWGCGAFGGNRRLMIALQVIAARAAGVAELVLHAGDPAGADDAERGVETADGLATRCGSPCKLRTLIERTEMLACRWGFGDGN